MSETPNPEPQPKDSAQDLDQWKAEARKWEERSKSNKAEVDSLTQQLEQLNSRVSELETTNTTLTEQVTSFEQEKELAAMVQGVAKSKGVPAEALKGSTEEELNAHADVLKTILTPSAPVIPGQAQSPGEPPADPAVEAVKSLFGNNQ